MWFDFSNGQKQKCFGFAACLARATIHSHLTSNTHVSAVHVNVHAAFSYRNTRPPCSAFNVTYFHLIRFSCASVHPLLLSRKGWFCSHRIPTHEQLGLSLRCWLSPLTVYVVFPTNRRIFCNVLGYPHFICVTQQNTPTLPSRLKGRAYHAFLPYQANPVGLLALKLSEVCLNVNSSRKKKQVPSDTPPRIESLITVFFCQQGSGRVSFYAEYFRSK